MLSLKTTEKLCLLSKLLNREKELFTVYVNWTKHKSALFELSNMAILHHSNKADLCCPQKMWTLKTLVTLQLFFFAFCF